MPTSPYSVIYAFGDSLSDAGNTYLLSISDIASALGFSHTPVSPPYAQISYNGVSADVFSNGPVWTQDLASALGLAEPAPSGAGATADALRSALTSLIGNTAASLAVTGLEATDGVSGPNPYVRIVGGASGGGNDFAISGAVTGITTENSDPTVQLYDLDAQLTTFEHDVPTPTANALTTVSIGGNDVINLVGDTNFGTLYPSGTTLANVGSTQAGLDIAQSVSIEVGFLGALAGLGVDNILVMNVPDVGKTPKLLADGPATAADATVLSQYYDNLLASDVAAMNNGTLHIAIDDAFSLIDSAVATPAPYGLQNVSDPVYSGSDSTFTPGDLVSADPATQNGYLFFDTEHPTETGAAALAEMGLSALNLACFATGTHILTTDGEVPVEKLGVGASVVLANGCTAPVVWLGRTSIDCAAGARPHEAWPVRVSADAFGPGVPMRNLYLSSDHAVFVHGALIPVRYLINGGSVAQHPCRKITYWHAELDAHAVLLAEGLPVESYLDTGNRAAFETGDNAALAVRSGDSASSDHALKDEPAHARSPAERIGPPGDPRSSRRSSSE